MELEASQDELDELDKDESTEPSMDTLPESHLSKHQLHEKHKQVKKVEKQAKIQELQFQLAETDQQFDLLIWKTSAQPTSGKGACQPAATSTPQIVTQQDQSWLQQADIDAADAFLNQLDDTLAKGADSQKQPADKSSKTSKKGSQLNHGLCCQTRNASALTCQRCHLINCQMSL